MDIAKSGYLSDIDNNKLLYFGNLTFNDKEITFSGRGIGFAAYKSFRISIPINKIKNVSIKNYLIQKYVYLEFSDNKRIRRVLIRPLKIALVKLFDESKKWEDLILAKIQDKKLLTKN